MESVVEFDAKGYAHLKNFLDLNSCEQLVFKLKETISQGLSHKDNQCTISESVQYVPAFDSILEALQPNFEYATGKKLLPTYSYARLYKTGEILEPHKDRAACEISVTITLGFKDKPWPIFVDGEEIVLGVGDALLYKGHEKLHWRDEFKGEWQAQVFLHYVDAAGEFTDQKYDGRKNLAHKEDSAVLPYWWFEKGFSIESCKKIIYNVEEENSLKKAKIGYKSNSKIDLSIRDVNSIPLPVFKGVGASLTGMGIAANVQAWQFNVTHSNQCDFLQYTENGHYLEHVDNVSTYGHNNILDARKLTTLVFLNEDFEGGRFFLKNQSEKIYPPQKTGDVVVFPSYILHGVEPVTSGIRRTIVTWLVGPAFK